MENKSSTQFKVCTWNQLIDDTPQGHAFANQETKMLLDECHTSFKSRLIRLHSRVTELVDAGVEVFCFQENWQADQHWVKFFDALGFATLWIQKDRRENGLLLAYLKKHWKLASSLCVSDSFHGSSPSVPDVQINSAPIHIVAMLESKQIVQSSKRFMLGVATTHLKAKAECDDIRKQQVKHMLGSIKMMQQLRNPDAFLLMGDLNANVYEQCLKDISANNFQSVWTQDELYNSYTTTKCRLDKRSGNAKIDQSVKDYVFLNVNSNGRDGNDQRDNVEITWKNQLPIVCRDRDRDRDQMEADPNHALFDCGSDHLPLVVELQINK